jgi:hypothetical protein
MSRLLAITLFVAVLAALPRHAAAQGQSSENKAAADALFDQAKQLFAAGDLEKACAMFEGSLRLAEQLGTRLNLADCYEKIGRTASAWAEFREAATLAAKKGDKREQFARSRVAELQPKLVKVVVVVPHRVKGLAVHRDGVTLSDATFDVETPIDPGKHTFEASADGYHTWSQEVDVGTEGVARVEVPALKEAPKPKLSSLDPAEEARRARKTRRTIAFVVGGVGVAGLATSIALGLAAKSKWDDAQPYCVDNVCDPMGAQINSDARGLADTATIVAGVGAAALVTGVVLYLTAPKVPAAEKPVVGIMPAAGGWTVTLGGQF